ncbi:unnamed protein product [Rhodiola kirilowii]
MIVFIWNCQGLGRPRTVRALRHAIKSHSPQIVCLLETKKRAFDVEGMKYKFGFQNCFGVSSKGQSGGLAVLWDDSVSVDLRSYSFYHIDVVVKDQEEFWLSLFYGNPAASRRRESWNLLRQLRAMDDLQWVVLGDFNEILSLNEARGGRMRNQWQIHNFRRVVEDCHLIDLGFVGYPYTFSNRRKGEEEVQARLDRVLADEAWKRKFPKATVSHLHLHASDHQLILMNTDSRCRLRRKKLFRFEVMWFNHQDYSKMMEDFWINCGNNSDGWPVNLNSCKEMLKAWSRSSFGDMRRKIQSIKQELNWVKCSPRTQIWWRGKGDYLRSWIGG